MTTRAEGLAKQLEAKADEATVVLTETPLSRAIELLAAGEWKPAHEIVQKDTSTLAAWLHGIVHILEGDLRNARGWYQKADRTFPGADAVQDEISAARRAVQAEHRAS